MVELLFDLENSFCNTVFIQFSSKHILYKGKTDKQFSHFFLYFIFLSNEYNIYIYPLSLNVVLTQYFYVCMCHTTSIKKAFPFFFPPIFFSRVKAFLLLLMSAFSFVYSSKFFFSYFNSDKPSQVSYYLRFEVFKRYLMTQKEFSLRNVEKNKKKKFFE